MKLIILTAVLLFTAAATAVPAPLAAATVEQQIDTLVQQVLKDSHIPGLAVGIVEGDRAIYLKGFGAADGTGRPVTPQTPFIIGSLSKSFTAVAAMQMVEAGKLDLDAPVQRYLPWFRVADAEASAKITVRDLLNHKSGLPTSAGSFLATLDDRTGAEGIVRQMATLKLTAAPGALYQYCNLNYITVGLIVETLSGIPFDQYISQRIMKPLRMTHSFTAEGPAIADGMAAGHTYLGGLVPLPHRAPYSRGRLAEGYMIASAEDMNRYLLALMNGGATVLSPASVKELFTPAAAMGPGQGSYGMGWAISFLPSRTRVYEHDGETPGFRPSMAILPESGRALIILANAKSDATGGVARLSNALIALLRDQLPMLAPAHVSAGSYVLLIAPPAALLWALWDLLRLPRWRRRAQRLTDWAWSALSLVLALGCIAGVPLAAGGTPRMMWAVDPYTTAAVFATGGLTFAAFCYRCLILLARRKNHPAIGGNSASA